METKIYRISSLDNTFAREVEGIKLDRCGNTGQIIIFDGNWDIVFMAPKEAIVELVQR